jgi:hypothetical protein|tara:strand:+ start:257 stop:523 length:267 start_codon:yes stop_codon:yes gene_type:complete
MTNFKFNLDSLKSGRIFSITFEKADGTVKTINARLGVRKHLNGKGMRYVPENYNLMVLWSMTDKGYRAVKRDKIKSIKSNGVLYSKLT